MKTKQDKRDDGDVLNQQSSVWSELRAIELLNRVQKDIIALKKANARLQLLLLLLVTLFAGSAIALGGMLAFTYERVQQIQLQPKN